MKLVSGSNLLYHAAFHIKYVFTYSNNLFITWLIQAFVNVAFSLQNELKQLFLVYIYLFTFQNSYTIIDTD